MGGDKIRKICGDGLLVQLESNDCVLEVKGDGCRITMAKNCGRVRVVGDGCHLKIAHNVGDIVYKGDGGQVQLGPESSKENVKYIGDGGKVTFDSNDSKCRAASTRGKRDRNRNHSDTSPNPPTLNNKYSSNEERENLLNERKETEQKSRRTSPGLDESSAPGRKSGGERLVKSKIITTLDCEAHEIVKKWFISPSSVVKSFDGGCIKVTSKRAQVTP